jgi:hypothetical protein
MPASSRKRARSRCGYARWRMDTIDRACRCGYWHRHDTEQASEAVPIFYTGGFTHSATLRRHGAGACHLAQARAHVTVTSELGKGQCSRCACPAARILTETPSRRAARARLPFEIDNARSGARVHHYPGGNRYCDVNAPGDLRPKTPSHDEETCARSRTERK